MAFSKRDAAADHSRAMQMWYFVASLIAIATIVHVTTLLLTWFQKKTVISNHTKELAEPAPNDRAKAISWRRLPKAIISACRIAAFRITIPIGSNSSLVPLYLVISFAYLIAIHVVSFAHSNGFDIHYWRDRVAHIAMAQMSLLPSLAGKNNIVSLLTGVSYEKINYLHRAASRACFGLILLHSFSHAPLTVSELADSSNKSAIVATVAFAFIFLFSLPPVRTHRYELFRWTHPVFIILLFVGAYKHQPKFAYYLYGAFLTWGADRAIRVFRILRCCNGTRKATIIPLTSDYVQVNLERRVDWKAGQHILLTIPSVSNLPFEDHPFTIASTPQCGNTMVLIIRVMDGFTKKLADLAQKEPGKDITSIVEGPYGKPPDLNNYSSVILIAGGSGISYTLPLLLDIIHKAVHHNNSSVQRVLFVWAVRDAVLMKTLAPTIQNALRSARPSLEIEVKIYITRAAKSSLHPGHSSMENPPADPIISPTESVEGSKSELALNLAASSTFWTKPIFARPDLHTLLAEEIELAKGSLSVDVSGPVSLTRAVRGALASDIAGPIGVLNGRPTVTLHTEGFGATPITIKT